MNAVQVRIVAFLAIFVATEVKAGVLQKRYEGTDMDFLS